MDKKNYRVVFCSENPVIFCSEEICTELSLEQAISFALSLHQLSNIPHEITIMDDEDFSVVLTLKKKLDV